MTSTGRINFSRALFAAGLALLMASCAGTKAHPTNGGEITKVKYFFLDQAIGNKMNARAIQDRSITFEREHFLYGAISNQERVDREGNYYTVFWKVEDRSQPVTVCFEFRQKGSGIAIKKLEQTIDHPSRSNHTDFSIVSKDYQTNGPVTCFRVTLRRGKEILHETKSFMWERQ
jgi:phosphatidate phosphatase PAH1